MKKEKITYRYTGRGSTARYHRLAEDLLALAWPELERKLTPDAWDALAGVSREWRQGVPSREQVREQLALLGSPLAGLLPSFSPAAWRVLQEVLLSYKGKEGAFEAHLAAWKPENPKA